MTGQPTPSGSHSPADAGYPATRGRPVDALPTEVYTPWISRVGAVVIDNVLLIVLAFIVGAAGGLVVEAAGGSSALNTVVALLMNLALLAYWAWNWGYRQGTTGATIGKSALRFKVVSGRTGEPMGVGPSIARQFAHLLDSATFGVGYLLPLFTARRQTIADLVLGTVCLPDQLPETLKTRPARPGVRLATGIVVLVVAGALTALACLTATGRWVCTGAGVDTHCGPRVVIGPFGYPAWSATSPHFLAVPVAALWTLGLLIVLRYYRATYLLVPVAGIVAWAIFSHGRYALGWEHNWGAFLGCVFVGTGLAVLLARAITRAVAARPTRNSRSAPLGRA